MPRVKWNCPGCKKDFRVPDATGLVLCPDCRVIPDIRPVRRKRPPRWTISDVAFVVISTVVVLGVSGLVANWFWGAIPKSDPEKVLVAKWLNENLDDERWDEVKWFPAQTPEGLHHLNLLHIIQSMEKDKEAYEKGLGKEENNVEHQKLYTKLRESGPRTFCALKFRATTLNGQAKLLRFQVFEIVNGKAKPLGSNDIHELPSSPNKNASRVAYDGLRFFDEREYDPFIFDPSEDLDNRFQLAKVWNAPEKAASAIAPIESQRQGVVNVPAVTQETEMETPSPIPAKTRAYFDRAMEVKSAEVAVLEKRLSMFQGRLNAAKITQKKPIEQRIRQTEDEIAELKRKTFPGFIPDDAEIGDIGSFQCIEVMEVVDDETLLARWHPKGKGRLPRMDIVISPIETSKIKIGAASVNVDLFKVTATRNDPADTLEEHKAAGRKVELIAEPFEEDEIEKWRGPYDKEYKNKK
jgi:hypothetical protein